MATSRQMRAATIAATRVFIASVPRSGGVDAVLDAFKSETSVLPVEMERVLELSFAFVDYSLKFICSDEFRREEMERKTSSWDNMFYGPLLNATNPVRMMPKFFRYVLTTRAWPSSLTLAEFFTFGSVDKKVKRAAKGLPRGLVDAMQTYVAAGLVHCSAHDMTQADLSKFVESEAAFGSWKESVQALHLFRCVKLARQSRIMMFALKQPEMFWVIDTILPLMGGPLGELFTALRIGKELQKFARCLNGVARQSASQESLDALHALLRGYIRKILGSESSLVARELVAWLIETLQDPVVFSVPVFLQTNFPSPVERASLWAEVDMVKTHLQSGGHFGSCQVPQLERCASYFHEQQLRKKK